MAAPSGRSFSGDDVAFFITNSATSSSTLNAALIKSIRETADGSATTKLAYAGLVGAAAPIKTDSGTVSPIITSSLGTGTVALKGVVADPVIGREVTSNTVNAYTSISFNVRTPPTLTDVELSMVPDHTTADAKALFVPTDSTFIPDGTLVLFLVRFGLLPSADHIYHLTLGSMGGMSVTPSRTDGQGYTRRIIAEASLFGYASS